MKCGKNCPKNLITLSPFVDENNLIRVGGRLENLNVPFENKHPLLLPKNGNFSKLLCRYFHVIALHGGSNISTGILRSHFWIISGKQLMKQIIHSCTTCSKFNPKNPSPIQGDLPKFRLESTFCFRDSVGCDVFGPFPYKITNRKNSPTNKIYGLIFVCENTRAVHIEPLTSLSCKDFLAAVDRFTARRSIPKQFRSDCGSNFKSGFKKMSELQNFLTKNENEIISNLATRSIKYKHLPPYSPWMSSWETLIRCTKRLLKPLLTSPLYFEEYNTIFAKVEMILNSKPYLTPSQDPRDNTQLLCPGNLLVGGTFLAPPTMLPYDCKYQSTSPNARWDRLNTCMRLFWKRFNTEILHTLAQKHKWPKGSKNVNIGDLVWVTDDVKTIPSQWPMGLITSTFPDKNGIVRIVNVRLVNGKEIQRAVRNLVLIPN